jgi:hypothetical protein
MIQPIGSIERAPFNSQHPSNAMPLTTGTSSPTASALSPRTLWLMAIACGVCVANICYNQPLLGDFALYWFSFTFAPRFSR